MARKASNRTSRRDLLKQAAAGAGLGIGALAVGCRPDHRRGDGPDHRRRRRLRAAFSSADLKSTWNRSGQQAARLWGELLDVDVQWFDGEGDAQKQREKIEGIAHEPWDFCAFQANQTGVLEEAVKRLKSRGIPVIAMDESGSFCVAWQDDRQQNRQYDILARGFNADGTPRFADMTVNSAPGGRQTRPAIGMI